MSDEKIEDNPWKKGPLGAEALRAYVDELTKPKPPKFKHKHWKASYDVFEWEGSIYQVIGPQGHGRYIVAEINPDISGSSVTPCEIYVDEDEVMAARQAHFEWVQEHGVQVILESVPEGLQALPCLGPLEPQKGLSFYRQAEALVKKVNEEGPQPLKVDMHVWESWAEWADIKWSLAPEQAEQAEERE